jgi:hypothetical protein
VLASRLDQASAAYRGNRSANLRLLGELLEQLAQSKAGGDERYVATGARHRPVGLLVGGGEGHGRLRGVPDVITKIPVANRGKIARQVTTTGRLIERSRRSKSSTAHGDRLDCEQIGFELFPSSDGRTSSKASYLSADDTWPLTCSRKWIGPGGACIRA